MEFKLRVGLGIEKHAYHHPLQPNLEKQYENGPRRKLRINCGLPFLLLLLRDLPFVHSFDFFEIA